MNLNSYINMSNTDTNKYIDSDTNTNTSSLDYYINSSKFFPVDEINIDEKSWIKNSITKESKLIINDVDNNEIPEILKEYHWLLELEINNQSIKELKNLPINLKTLNISNNNIKYIQTNILPKTLEILNISNNNIKILENIPISIKELDCSNNLINKCILHENKELIYLNISHNNIEIFPELNNNIKKLYISNNKIKNINKFPDNLLDIDLENNFLVFVNKLPNTLLKANFSNNKINDITYNENYELDGNYILNLKKNPLLNIPDKLLENPKIQHDIIIKKTIKYIEVIQFRRIIV